ncbi:hypothetical protein [Streptosporangium sp. NPDC002607]
MSAQPLLVDADDTSVVVSLNRAAVRNALDLATVEALHTVCARLEKHPRILALRLTKALIHAPRSAHPLVANLAQAVLFETEEKKVRMDAYLDRRTVRP